MDGFFLFDFGALVRRDPWSLRRPAVDAHMASLAIIPVILTGPLRGLQSGSSLRRAPYVSRVLAHSGLTDQEGAGYNNNWKISHQERRRDWPDEARQPAQDASGDAGAGKVPNPAAEVFR